MFRPARALPKRKTHTVHAMRQGELYTLCGKSCIPWSSDASFSFADLLPTCDRCKRELRDERPFDTASSASRQHFIDTGIYLREGEAISV